MDFELESQVEHAGDIDPTLGDVDLDSDFGDNVNDVDPTTCDNSNVPNDEPRVSLTTTTSTSCTAPPNAEQLDISLGVGDNPTQACNCTFPCTYFGTKNDLLIPYCIIHMVGWSIRFQKMLSFAMPVVSFQWAA